MFSVKVGLLATFFRSVIFSLIIQDHNIGLAYPSELAEIWFIYFLYTLHRGETGAFVWLALLAGMMFTVHPVILPLVVVAGISLFKLPSVKWGRKILAKSALAFLAPIVPQLVFEIRHRFVHLLTPAQTFLGSSVVHESLTKNVWYIFSYDLGNFYRLLDNVFLPWWVGFFVFAAIIWMIIGVIFPEKEPQQGE